MSIGYPGDLRWRPPPLGGGPGDDSQSPFTGPPNTILPDRWDTRLRQAGLAAAAKTSVIFVSVYGASDEVYFATDSLTTSWCGLQRARLVAKYGLAGDFYHIRMNIVDSPNWGGTPPIVANAAGGRTPTPGAYGGTSNYTALNTTLWTFTSQYSCGEIDVHYLDTGTAFTYSVDGGGFVATGVSAGGTNSQKRLRITGLDPTKIHVVAIQQTVSQSAIICGFSTWVTSDAQTFGVFYARLTYPGSSTFDWYRQDTSPIDKIIQISGSTTALAPVTGSYGPPMKPDLAILCGDLAGNDMIQGTDLENMSDGLLKMMGALRRSVDGCTIASLIVSVPNGITSDLLLANTVPNASLWPLYKAEWLSACARMGVGVFDLDTRWGQLGVAKGFQANIAGGFHMSQLGNNDADQFLALGGL